MPRSGPGSSFGRSFVKITAAPGRPSMSGMPKWQASACERTPTCMLPSQLAKSRSHIGARQTSSSSWISTLGSPYQPTTLFTSTSRPPRSSATRAKRAAVSSAEPCSQRTPTPSPPRAVTSSAVSSTVPPRSDVGPLARVPRPLAYTVAPHSPSTPATARPTPRVAPVTSAMRPRRSGAVHRSTATPPSDNRSSRLPLHRSETRALRSLWRSAILPSRVP